MPEHHTRSAASESERKINAFMQKGDKIQAANAFLHDRTSGLYVKALVKARETMKESKGNTPSVDAEDVVMEQFWYCMEHYDSTRSDNFAAYFMTYIGYKAKDVSDTRRVSGELDDTSTPGNEGIPDEMSEGKSTAAAMVLKLLTPVTRFAETGFQKKVYPYFKCFATDFIICICKEGLYRGIEINENDTLCAIDTAFLDYTFTDTCRVLSEIEHTPLKTYKTMGFSEKEEELKCPFEQVVFTSYLGVSNGAVTQNKEKFFAQVGIDKKSRSWTL